MTLSLAWFAKPDLPDHRATVMRNASRKPYGVARRPSSLLRSVSCVDLSADLR